MNYYLHHIGDYAAATAYLSLMEDAIYTRLLRVYYRDEKPLPADSATVAWLIGLRSRKEKETLNRLLPQFFTLHEDGWHNARADEEITAYRNKQTSAQENGKKGGRPKAGAIPEQSQEKPNSNPQPNPSETQTKPSDNPEQTQPKANQEPITSNQEPTKATAKACSSPSSDNSMNPDCLLVSDSLRTNCAKNAQSAQPKTEPKPKPKPKSAAPPATNPLLLKPDDVSERSWCDFITHRRGKRTTITENVIKIFRREAEKAGIPLEEAINITVYQGWQGFRADWYANLNRSSTSIHIRNGTAHAAHLQHRPDTSAVGRIQAAIVEAAQRENAAARIIEGDFVVASG